MPKERTYPIAPFGFATSFEESEVPAEYALQMRNRFINAAGGAEKRQGIDQLGSTISGTPKLDAIHELIGADGTATLFVSGEGKIWRFDNPGWTQVRSGLDANSQLQSSQMGPKLIFVNGVDRNFYTEDGSTFHELLPIIEQGTVSSTANTTQLTDSSITNWVTDTDVAANDIVYNVSVSAFGIITTVSADRLVHTNIGVSAQGIGAAAANQTSGHLYKVLDSVELNVIPTDIGDDNVATAAVGTSATGIVVSAVSDWTKTQIRPGDWIHNTTRSALTEVTAVSTAALRCAGIASQTSGDTLTFHKSAMPISKKTHVHFGRLYHIDARDQRLIRISGANDPQDMTNDSGTLDTHIFRFGELQPQGDIVLDMASFQRFLGIAGKQALYLFQGTNPVADVSAASTDLQIANATDFDIVSIFPQGVVSPNSLVSIGNALIFVTPDGVQSSELVYDASTLTRANISEALKTTLRGEIKNTAPEQIRALHYPRRSWVLLKVGSRLYVYNYTPFFGKNVIDQSPQPGTGSWSLFDGKFARQNAYFVRSDRTLIAAGDGGKVYQFDQGSYSDDGETYITEYQTGWLNFEEGAGARRALARTKDGQYIKPIIDSGGDTSYTIRAEAGFGVESTDTITVPVSGGAQPIGLAEVGKAIVGGSSIQDIKYPLRWRGREVRLTFSTNDNTGPDVLSRFTLYVNLHGQR